MYCPSCGKELDDTANFCHACGYDVQALQTVDEKNHPHIDHRVFLGTLEYAGFWRRYCALLIDMLLLGVTAVVIYKVLLLAGMLDRGGNGLFFLIMVMFAWVYFAFWESSGMQATLGKQLFGIVITDLYGARISFPRATGRYFARFASTLPLFFGYFIAVWSQNKQTVHDLLANTLVVETDTEKGRSVEFLCAVLTLFAVFFGAVLVLG